MQEPRISLREGPAGGEDDHPRPLVVEPHRCQGLIPAGEEIAFVADPSVGLLLPGEAKAAFFVEFKAVLSRGMAGIVVEAACPWLLGHADRGRSTTLCAT